MDYFQFKDGVLHAEDVALSRIAEEVGTPVYVYSRATLEPVSYTHLTLPTIYSV